LSSQVPDTCSRLSVALQPQRPTLFPYTTLFRSQRKGILHRACNQRTDVARRQPFLGLAGELRLDHLHRQHIAATGPHVIRGDLRSEEHTSELQSRFDLVCRLLLVEKNRMLERYG